MTIALPASLTLSAASAELARLQALAAAQAGEVVLDASALQEVDSSCLAVLLQCRREALGRGLGFRVDHPPEKLQALMKLYGVAELF